MNSATLELFESVRSVLNGRQLDEAEWRELAMRVGETAAGFRRRLDRAVRYARMGLRLEAASEAETEPALFELAQLLDSDDYHKWRALCTRQSWPVPELPDPAALGEVEESISQLRPLRKLLARMRVLVLSDAGPWERMQLLHELAGRDPHNPVWKDDIEAIEPVCAQWLADRADATLKEGRLDAATQSIACLEQTAWKHTAVDRRLAELRARLNAAVVARCAEDASLVVAALEREWAAENAEGVEARLDEWRELASRAEQHHGALPQGETARAAAVQAWAGERIAAERAQREHHERASELEAMLLGERCTLKDLRRALAASDATDEGCPEPLRRRALDEVGNLERRANMKRTVSALAAIACVAAMVAGIWWGVSVTAQDNRIQSLANAVRGHVAAGSLDEAGRVLAEADQDLATSGDQRMTDARREYMSARAAIAQGDREFDGALADAGDPDAADSAAADIARADELARTDAQHAAVDGWKRLQKRAEDARIAARVQDQLKEVRAVAQAAAALKLDDAAPTLAAAMADLNARLAAVSRAAQGQPAVLREVEGAKALLAAHQGTLQSRAASEARLEELRSLATAAGDPLALRLALESFARDHEGSPEAALIGPAVAAAPLWASIAEWNRIGNRHALGKAATAPQPERDAMNADLRAYATAHVGSPYAPHARALASQLVPAQGWRIWLDDKLTQLPEFGYFSIELRDGSRLYLLRDPGQVATQTDPGGQAYRIYSVLANGGVDPKSSFQRIDVSSVKTQGRSPQAALATGLKDLLEHGDEDPSAMNDVQAALTALARIRDADAVDGAFAALVARGVLETLEREVPAPLQGKVQAAARRIAREKPEEVDWVGASASARERGRAFRALLRDVLKVEEWRKAYAEGLAEAAAPLLKRYAPVGVVLRDQAGGAGAGASASSGSGAGAGAGVQAPAGHPLLPGTDLYVLRVGVGNTPSEMELVGRVDSAGAVQPVAALETVAPGTLVFGRQDGAK